MRRRTAFHAHRPIRINKAQVARRRAQQADGDVFISAGGLNGDFFSHRKPFCSRFLKCACDKVRPPKARKNTLYVVAKYEARKERIESGGRNFDKFVLFAAPVSLA